MSWTKLELKAPDPKLAEKLAELIGQIKTYLQTQVALLEALLEVMQGLADPLAAALKLLIDEMNRILESLLEDFGAYALFVPLSKRLMTNFNGYGDLTPGGPVGKALFLEPYASAASAKPELNKFLVDVNRYSGGNYGFIKNVWQSLYDAGDINRPMFGSGDYVGGAVLVIGSSFDPLGFLDEIWTFGGLFKIANSIPKFPRPKNLKGRAITTIGSGQFSALLSWDAMDFPTYHLDDLGGTVYYPYRYAILRGTSAELLAASNIIDLIGKREIIEGDTFGTVTVIKEDEFDLTTVSYYDLDVLADTSDTFYYAVAWRCKGFGADEKITADGGVADDYWNISNVIRLTPYPIIPASTPPDWIRSPSAASLLPPVAEFLRMIAGYIENFSNKLLGNLDAYKAYVSFLQSEILRYEALINSILDQLAKMSSLLRLPTNGIYIRLIPPGVGGNDYWLSDMVGGFMEEDCPPFRTGSEYVMGAVFLCGGPAAQVGAFVAALGLLFGAEDSEMSRAMQEVGEITRQMEETTFGEDFTPEPAPTVHGELGAASSTSTIGYSASDAVQCKCDHDAETVYVFDAHMKKV